MTTTELTRPRHTIPSALDWLSLAWPSNWAPGIRIEDVVQGDHYLIRAEIPGVEPAKDVRITCRNGELRLEVTRTEEKRDNARTEFHYGTFARTVALPTGAKEDTITATYEKGILEITVEIAKPMPAEHVIEVREIDGARDAKKR